MDVKARDINLQPAWKITRGAKKVVIAIIDIRPDHATECARIASLIAPGCTTMTIPVPANASQKLLASVFRETAQIADVISCSWSPPPSNVPLTQELFRTFQEISTNTVLCFSAGNYNAPVNDPHNNEFFWLDEQTNMYRIAKGPIINGYAAHPDVMAIGACTLLNEKAAYSNWGKEVKICAPSDNYHPLSNSFKVPGKRSGFGGTSNACPIVAAVAGLMLSANPILTPKVIRTVIEMTADSIQGFAGKINAGAAVILAKKITHHTSEIESLLN